MENVAMGNVDWDLVQKIQATDDEETKQTLLIEYIQNKYKGITITAPKSENPWSVAGTRLDIVKMAEKELKVYLTLIQIDDED